jgi:hypothetical protein
MSFDTNQRLLEASGFIINRSESLSKFNIKIKSESPATVAQNVVDDYHHQQQQHLANFYQDSAFTVATIDEPESEDSYEQHPQSQPGSALCPTRSFDRE